MVHAEEYSFTACAGPSVELVKHFVTYAFCTRDLVSAIGREGLGDSFELQIRYMLAKFVFPALKYNGWTGLNAHELHKKAEPYKFAVKEQWERLKRSDPDLMSTLKPFVKTKWCDTAYFQAQVCTLVYRTACVAACVTRACVTLEGLDHTDGVTPDLSTRTVCDFWLVATMATMATLGAGLSKRYRSPAIGW